MTILNQIRNHGLHYLHLKLSFAHKIARENLSSHVFYLVIIFFPEDIQSKFTVVLQFKKIEMKTAAANFIKIHKINFSLQKTAKQN